MKIRNVAGILSVICLVISGAMLFPLVLALIDRSHDAWAFGFAFLAGGAVSLLLRWIYGFKPMTGISIGIREGVGVTGFSWVIASAVGALPYVFAGVCGYTDAFFETMSGFTTTGATIMTDIEALPRGILLWRSLTHWMGGMGIIVLSLAVVPFLGVRGMEMYKAEVPGITADKLTPRLHQTAVYLWTVYVSLTLAETVLLMFGGLSLFEAFCHSCSTIATGGFSTRNASAGAFGSYVQWVLIAFMFASGVNFSLYFMPRLILRDEEFRAYVGIAVVSALAMAAGLWVCGMGTGLEGTLRRAAFNVVSVMTTTGFVIEDYNLWPEFTRFMFIVLMFVGASGGSTGGGCKVSRFLVLGKKLKAETQHLLHPRALITARMNGVPVSRSTFDSAGAFFVLYMLMLVVGTVITAAFGIDVLTAFTGVITCLSNVGPGLNLLGPVENFAWLPGAVKWLFSFLMLAGRLELFAVFLLFLPGTYRK
ncbi:MAG: TrkH family potassium uptake protein [Synergistaceae bacterium]|nr:TrkH family potassium uptake protein [Synergistaceae bacterium]